MSHITTKAPTGHQQIRDLTLLGRACEKLGLEFDTQARRFSYYRGQTRSCVGAIRPRLATPLAGYEIGLQRSQTAGCYDLAFDDYESAPGGSNEVYRRATGRGHRSAPCGRLLMQYDEEVTRQLAAVRGDVVLSREELADGSVIMIGGQPTGVPAGAVVLQIQAD